MNIYSKTACECDSAIEELKLGRLFEQLPAIANQTKEDSGRDKSQNGVAALS